jgi:hypothetical protein
LQNSQRISYTKGTHFIALQRCLNLHQPPTPLSLSFHYQTHNPNITIVQVFTNFWLHTLSKYLELSASEAQLRTSTMHNHQWAAKLCTY